MSMSFGFTRHIDSGSCKQKALFIVLPPPLLNFTRRFTEYLARGLRETFSEVVSMGQPVTAFGALGKKS